MTKKLGAKWLSKIVTEHERKARSRSEMDSCVAQTRCDLLSARENVAFFLYLPAEVTIYHRN